ncbi:MAG: efflux RND transporter permease subunit, partial [Acidithiobacillales bacterium]
MNISALFIRRPVATTLVMLGILFFGIVGYRLLPVSDLPNVDFPTIQVTASLPGASPETIASAIATPLEKQFTTIAGLDSMNSASVLGVTQITLQFNLSRSLDAAAQDVQAAIGAASRQLPPGMPNPPTYQKVNPADAPILYIALTSPTLPLSTTDEYAETMMAQRISTVSGVAQVLVYGAQKFAVRVQLDPRALASRGIGIDEASAAVAAANVNIPTGTLWGPTTAYTVMATGQLTEAAAFDPLIVAYRNGSPVRVRDIGRAVDSVENDKTAAWYVDKSGATRGVVLAIQKQPGENTVEVVSNIK